MSGFIENGSSDGSTDREDILRDYYESLGVVSFSAPGPRLVDSAVAPQIQLDPLTLDNAQELFSTIDESRDHPEPTGLEYVEQYQDYSSFLNDKFRQPNDLQESYLIRLGSLGDWVPGVVEATATSPIREEYELGIFLGSKWLRQGIARRTIKLLTDDILERGGVKQVKAYIEPENERSADAFRHCGFVLQKTVHERDLFVKRKTT